MTITGLHQESQAEKNLAALQDIIEFTGTVRRDGRAFDIGRGALCRVTMSYPAAGERVQAEGR
ncbi:MAG: hypothetical protein KAV87_18720 [Desulfobacteraceae bacterium]|nr:hypothetical protein [Desulfobacteraceae bacterium]